MPRRGGRRLQFDTAVPNAAAAGSARVSQWLAALAKGSYALEAATWPLWFLAYVLCMWTIPYNSTLLLRAMPNVPALFSAMGRRRIVSAVKVPATRYASWQLGQIAKEAQLLLSPPGSDGPASTAAADGPASTAAAASKPAWGADMADASVTARLSELRAQAAGLLDMQPEELTLPTLLQLGTAIAEREAPNAVAMRVKGLFKFANVMWLVGILGVAISLGPAMVVLFGPLIKLLLAWAHTAVTVLHLVARPFYWGAALYLCTAVVAAAQLQPEPASSRLSLAGVALAVATLWWAVAVHNPDDYTTEDVRVGTRQLLDVVDPILLVNMFTMLALVPLAHAHKSQLLGFFAVAALFGALGFVVIPTGFGWLVGWGSEDAMLATAGAASVLITVLIIAKAVDPQRQTVAPFQLGLSVFGTMTLLLAGLIRTSWYYDYNYDYDSNSRAWALWNGGYACLLTVLTLAGALLGMGSMFSVGSTFIVLWLSEKAVEVMVVQDMAWVAALAGSLGLCGGAYFIHTHPAWISTMLS